MTQIAEALAQAGYQDAEEWPSKALRDVAEKAMIAHASDPDAMQRAILDACCPRNSLARALFGPWSREPVAALVAEMRRLMRATQGTEGLSVQQRRLQKIIALDEERALAAARAARQRETEDRARAAGERERKINEWLNNKAAYETIDGQYWWLATPARICAHARKTTHSAKFWNLIAEQLSSVSHDERQSASKYLRPNEIDPLWNKAWGNETPN